MSGQKKTPASQAGAEVSALGNGVQVQGSAIPSPNLSDAQAFLTALDPKAKRWTFQTFDDNAERKASALARVLHGTLVEHAEALQEFNRQGAGVFVTINETDGTGRKASNIKRVRAVFADFDGTTLPEKVPQDPHIVVQSSPGNWHVYWRVDGLTLEQFGPVQRALAQTFGSDPAVADVARVMRLPGFLHCKHDPQWVRLHKAGEHDAYPARAFWPLPKEQAASNGSGHVRANMPAPEVIADLRSALNSLRADDRQLWIAIGQALHELGDVGRGLWMDWAQTSSAWKPGDAQQWDGFKGDRTGYQAVFKYAQDAGWLNPRSKQTGGTVAAGKANDSTVKIVSASAIAPEPICWLWHGWLARGKLTVLAGAPGTGKTTLALQWAAALSAGELLPGAAPLGRQPPRRVLIWSGEDDPADTLVPRLIAAGANLDYVGIVSGMGAEGTTRAFDPAHDMEALAQAVGEQGGDVSMILLDPLVNAVVGDSHKNTEVRRSLQPAVDLAQRMDAALLGITHFTKGTQGRDPLERVTGSLAFGALPRVVIGAGRAAGTDDTSNQLVFVRVKANNAAPGGGYLYHIEQVTVGDHIATNAIVYDASVDGTARALLGDPERDAKEKPDDAADFLRGLLGDGPIKAKEVFESADEAGFSVGQMRRAKTKLHALVKKDGLNSWLWYLPESEK